MRLTTSLVLALVVLAAAPAYVLSDGAQCDCAAQAQKAAEQAVQQAVAKVSAATEQKCQSNIEAIKTQHQQLIQEREAALSSSCSDKTSAASKTIEQLRSELASSTSHLSTLRSQLADAETKLKAAEAQYSQLAASSSASGASMAALRAELDAAKDKVAALEKAWVPLPAQTLLSQVAEYTQEKYSTLAASEHGQKAHALLADVLAKVADLWEQAQPHVHAFLHTAQLKLKVVASQVEGLYRKHVNDADWLKEAQVNFDRVHGELRLVVKQVLKDAPAPFATSDPVLVQYIVYCIFALPGLILVWLLAALTCGTRKPARTSSGGSARPKGGKRTRV